MLNSTLVVQQAEHYVSEAARSRDDSPWSDTLVIPLYVSCFSFLVLVTKSSVCLAWRSDTQISPLDVKGLNGRVTAHGGAPIFTSEAIRLLVGCVVVAGLSISWFLTADVSNRRTIASFCLTLIYNCILAFFAIFSERLSVAVSHARFILAIAWGVLFVRDIVPFLTYTESPAEHGSLVWAIFCVLTFTGVLLPLFTPRKYVPFDPANPTPPNPVQTASPLTRILFIYLDKLVWKAYHALHLPLSELPPLADEDQVKNLVRIAFPQCDPLSKMFEEVDDTGKVQAKKAFGHWRMLLGLIVVFRRELATSCFLIACQTGTQLLSPYVLRQLLMYLEKSGEGAIVRPWVWALSLFLAPFVNVVLMQNYQQINSIIIVRMESILTQLVLQHALRIRMVADISGDEKTSPSGTTTPVTSESTAAPIDAESTSTGGPDGQPTETAEARSDLGTTVQESEDSTVITPPTTAPATSKSLVGRMNNLISADLQSLGRSMDVLQILVSVPIGIIGSTIFLYKLLGWSALAGLGITLLGLPLPRFLAKLLQNVSREMAKKSDDRVELVTETLSVIRMVKMFGWERKMSESINEKRQVELEWLFKNKVLALLTRSCQFIIPCLTEAATYSFYALVMKGVLDAATVFASIALFNILRTKLAHSLFFVPPVIKAKVSLDRITDFLTETELLDEFAPESETFSDMVTPIETNEIGFRAASFTWSNESNSGATTPSKRRFTLRVEEELLFKKGCINLIVGPTGCGKTSLLMALLGEMHFVQSGPDSWFNLPRAGGVAYAAQESWVMNATIKENILFDSLFNEDRYSQVIHQCGLTHDLSLFDAGDETEIGERGLTLSGGQKARVTLARAVYSSAEIILLDDVLAALDVHTAKWIVEKCFTGPLVQGRTLLLVTHNVSITAPIAEFVVSLGSDGQILSQGTMSDALAKNWKLREEARQEKEVEERAAAAVDVPDLDEEASKKEDKKDGKLVLEEETAEGHISWQSFKMYIEALGGPMFWSLFALATIFECIIEVLQPWILGQWANQYLTHRPEDVNVTFYLALYILFCAGMSVVYAIAQMILFKGALRASGMIHRRLISSILRTTLRWLDKTPVARIITRCTLDVSAIDSVIPDGFSSVFEVAVVLTVRFFVILIFTPRVGLVGIVIAAAGVTLGNIYMKAQLSVKREMSKAKAPVVAHFGAAVEGIISIRAYGAQESTLLKSAAKIDEYTRANRVFNDLSKWISIRVNGMGSMFAAALGFYYVYGHTNVNTSNAAFTLTLAFSFGQQIIWFVQQLNQFEVNGNSLERLQQYMVIEQEPSPTEDRLPPAYWPSSGELKVENLSARYSADGPKVLDNISFEIKAGERVGIVGRTGSGKSSLTLALLRCIITEGEVYYDGLPISSVNLDSLRSHITIIPQVPELLSGTLRRNLDPFDQFDDATLNSALRSAGLFSVQNEGEESMITLDTHMARGGSNLSVGQRQIIALARAMVLESKLLILDEATSAIDYKTDAVIQESLRTELKKDVTVITVAHRLQTIMDADKIMVLDAGEIVEFDRPSELLKKEDGFLKSLVDESGDKDALYAVARSSS
ncbi:P-loop containing nucleoside triphosphate hydrolase protein [Stereum hirsutum FP-91666 SS1]|uniref:p-loop containing nucleoside triphosphate hydrolase protein n=1 Tax=Stereum hirsutum (strain FP-91666) TaxID=721885 RepID=R7RZL1_STEHR|nr:P-loop containing nucleoside triphosphate hydrolase protein [Stereum hirsutum FP-91666 SS1]EIM80350.1 P-loop containing nucleoside triphosphate hydrolase protein [Stereum hirsutum FP-91666 SS1]